MKIIRSARRDNRSEADKDRRDCEDCDRNDKARKESELQAVTSASSDSRALPSPSS